MDTTKTQEISERYEAARRRVDDAQAKAHSAMQSYHQASEEVRAAQQAMEDVGQDRYYDMIRYREEAVKALASGSAEYPLDASGRLEPEAVERACSHVFADESSPIALGKGMSDTISVRAEEGHDAALGALKSHVRNCSQSESRDVISKIGRRVRVRD
ncbi:MAG: hypothetical protein GIX03_00235 [Candidatus Eremiobacteraeota bacterium]|nr:hypothetical protein [Candidatus Eremiobacteraeota bacterium]MBC5801450.1 hypothetical protein [Candidatus Eremiobacteraeota bacterium]MBC5821281.1 hypothetical protein [Candidatus Eremiobacteraeota bacterium]